MRNNFRESFRLTRISSILPGRRLEKERARGREAVYCVRRVVYAPAKAIMPKVNAVYNFNNENQEARVNPNRRK